MQLSSSAVNQGNSWSSGEAREFAGTCIVSLSPIEQRCYSYMPSGQDKHLLPARAYVRLVRSVMIPKS